MISVTLVENIVHFNPYRPEDLPEFIALAWVESGNNDKKIGRKGEVSRYQIPVDEWKHYNLYPYYVHFWSRHKIAAEVAYMRYSNMLLALCAILKRQPNAYEFYLMWKKSETLNIEKIGYELRKKAMRYYHLVMLEQQKN